MDVYWKLISNVWEKYTLTKKGGKLFKWEGSGGNNYPSHERLVAEGWRLEIPPVEYDVAIHKLDNEDFDIIDAEHVSKKIILLTQEEIDLNKTTSKQSLVTFVKSEANRKIISILPEWKQRNASARAIELQEIRYEQGSLSDGEQEELNGIRSIFNNVVKPIRSASDLIESEVNSGEITTRQEIIDHILWP